MLYPFPHYLLYSDQQSQGESVYEELIKTSEKGNLQLKPAMLHVQYKGIVQGQLEEETRG